MSDITLPIPSRSAPLRPGGHSTAGIVSDLVLRLIVAVHSSATRVGSVAAARLRRAIDRSRDDRGQATTEYALVLLAAALVALLLVAWATAGGGAAKISRLFNRVIDAVIDRV